jgi:protein-S-isoprenylcysteine O-methyltransferase Ste14
MIWFYRLLVPAIFVIYLLYWWMRSWNVKSAVRVEPGFMGSLRTLMFWVAILLLCYPIPPHWLEYRILPAGLARYWSGVVVTVLGLLFSVWARQHLAGNWSQSVTIKKDHELVTSGPYRLVRHPIYTGLLTAFLGTAIVIGEVRGLLALLLVTAALWLKLRLEENWMREAFGDSYTEYSGRVAALIPGLL